MDAIGGFAEQQQAWFADIDRQANEVLENLADQVLDARKRKHKNKAEKFYQRLVGACAVAMSVALCDDDPVRQANKVLKERKAERHGPKD